MLAAARFLWKHRTISLLVLVGLAFAWQQHRLSEAREARVEAELALDSAAAAGDSTREVLTEALTGQARYYQRRIVQMRKLTADSVERELETEPAFRGDVTARVDELIVEEEGEATKDGGLRTATFAGYHEPYTFEAEVAVPPPAGPPPRMNLSVELDPLPLRLRVGCGPAPSGRDVRPAQATVRGPEWATLELDSLQADAQVCNPEALATGGLPWWVPVLGGVGVGFGIAVAF